VSVNCYATETPKIQYQKQHKSQQTTPNNKPKDYKSGPLELLPEYNMNVKSYPYPVTLLSGRWYGHM